MEENNNLVGIAVSKNKVPIRLNKERWFHITESHDYLSGLSDIILSSVGDPDEVVEGDLKEKKTKTKTKKVTKTKKIKEEK